MIYREHPNVGAILHVHGWIDGTQSTDVNYPCGTLQLAASVADLVRPRAGPCTARSWAYATTGSRLRARVSTRSSSASDRRSCRAFHGVTGRWSQRGRALQHPARLVVEQPALEFETERVTAERTAGTDHAMARHDQRDRIRRRSPCRPLVARSACRRAAPARRTRSARRDGFRGAASTRRAGTACRRLPQRCARARRRRRRSTRRARRPRRTGRGHGAGV